MPSLFNPVSRLYDHVSGLFAKIDDFDPLGTEQGLFARIVGTVQGALASSTSIATGGPVAPDYLPTDPASDEAEGNHAHALMEPNGSRRTRSQVLTWEGGLGRDDFPGSVLSPIWTATTSGGGTVTVASSLVTLHVGSASGDLARIEAEGDYQFIRAFFQRLRATARRTGCRIRFGFADDPSAPAEGGYFELTGTTSTVALFVTRSGSDAADIETSPSITLPLGKTTADTDIDWDISWSESKVSALILGRGICTNKLHIPHPNTILKIFAEITNTGATAGNTDLIIDCAEFNNHNTLEVQNSDTGTPITTEPLFVPFTVVGNYTNPNSTADQTVVSYVVPTGFELYCSAYALVKLDASGTDASMKIGHSTMATPGSGTISQDGEIRHMDYLSSAITNKAEGIFARPIPIARSGQTAAIKITPNANNHPWFGKLVVHLRPAT